MSLQLHAANEEIVAWAHTLEDRVAQKTEELRRTHDEVLHVETMASLGKLAAVVAHEINNPLAGILTYSKLLAEMGRPRRSYRREEAGSAAMPRPGRVRKPPLRRTLQEPAQLLAHRPNERREHGHQRGRRTLLALGAPQSRPCRHSTQSRASAGPASTFLRPHPNRAGSARAGDECNRRDAARRHALLSTGLFRELAAEIEIQVRDDGAGIPAEILPTIFEPFVTTKDRTHGTGLGLAVSRSIIERHSGKISIQSEVGKGTDGDDYVALDRRRIAALQLAGAGAYTNTR